MPVVVRDWGEAVMTSVSASLAIFLAAVPKVLGFFVILLIGWLIAALLAKVVATLLRAVSFNELAQRSGFSDFVNSMGVETDSAGFIAFVTKWFVRLIALVVAFDVLGLPAVSDVLRRLLLWLPNVVVGLVVLVIGGLAANALSSIVRGATARAEFGDPTLLASVAKIAVWAFAIVVAVNQIGIAETLVNTLFMAATGAVALAAGLAFGLGGREIAAEMWAKWYQKSREAAPRLQQAAEDAGREIEDRAKAERTRARH